MNVCKYVQKYFSVRLNIVFVCEVSDMFAILVLTTLLCVVGRVWYNLL